MKLALAQLNPIIGALKENTDKIIEMVEKAREKGSDMVLFSELVICGYPPQDLLLLPSFEKEMEAQLVRIIEASADIILFVGTIRKNVGKGKKTFFNSCAIIEDQSLVGYQDKALLPDYDVFFERRYFEPVAENKVWKFGGKRVAVTICEDIWQDEASNYIYDPIKALGKESIDLVVNLSASPFYAHRIDARRRICHRVTTLLKAPIAYCNQVGGNDQLIFDGYSFFMDSKGEITHAAKGFAEDLLMVDLEEKRQPLPMAIQPVADLMSALVLGLRDYFKKQGFTKAALGLSGGIDSAVTACIAAEALGKENVLAIGMPSRFTSDETMVDSKELSKRLGVSYKVISIEEPFSALLKVLNPHFNGKSPDTTEENLQARIRGLILMAFSNKFGHIILGPGNKSEMAMGYATLYGDMCGGIGVLSDVTKQGVYELANWINRDEEMIPSNILTKAPTAELKPGQKDQDTLPEYAIVDAVLEDYIEEHLEPEEIAKERNFPLELVEELICKIHFNEYKRRQAPPGLKVTKKAFSAGRHFPIVQKWVKSGL
ncbi:MAG: Glutamine-dependent NAD(+) synthetase [Chlamydiales bacterium]|nr:Glutamine-dependent NAD(+) synthetase [Chlamydiales bacterium]MCH9619835.1 Glutamine-dependent NAD(+) synthetase [Chlamydiales bacterium]MCH9622738.1 Glutamine-dependent NAD(+) synthetase [Chlamydiales bacterium]